MANRTRLDELKMFVQSQGLRWTTGKPIQYGEQILVSDGSHQVTINFYAKSGSLVPGGPDSPLKATIAAWIGGKEVPVAPLPTSAPMVGTRLDALKAFVQEQGWHWAGGADIQYGEQIVVSDGSATALVNFWPKRGKMQVQGSDSPLKAALQAWMAGAEGTARPASPEPITGPHIGLDESGKGDWFGPLVVAGVYVNERTAAALRSARVRDSKALDAGAIQRIAAHIERIVSPDHRYIWAIEPDTYNRLYARHNNINLLLADAYAQLAEKLWQSTKAGAIVCDQFAQRADRLESTFATRDLPRPIQRHHAESWSIGVAAASVLASAAFARALVELGAEAGLAGPLPKGASAQEALEAAARYIIQKHGAEALGHYAKLNFKPVRALLGGAVAVPSGSGPRPGPPVTVVVRAWEAAYHPEGFWQFRFRDGGVLNWYSETTGTLYMAGKPSARSSQLLSDRVGGKKWNGEREKIEAAIRKYVPEDEPASVPSVLGAGWERRDTVLGARFDFTDGAVLNYYRGRDTLTIQGTPSSRTRVALENLPSPFWSGLDTLTDTLKQVFPDWRMGEPARSEEAEGMTAGQEKWSPLDDALGWRAFWPADREMRMAANEKAPCQRALLDDWASVLAHHQGKRHLLAHAPTGLGKTLAALVPALAWVAQAPDRRRIYYLVNRVTQHDNPIRELRAGLAAAFEHQTGQPLRVVDIVGRNLLCRHPQARSLPDFCRQSRDAARFDALPDGVSSWSEVQARLGGRACPYHTLQGLMAQAHVVICDYWWLFSQAAQEGDLTARAGFSPADSILIVDEAHNLPLRVRAELDVDEPAERVVAAISEAPEQVRRCLEPVVAAVQQVNPDEGASPSALVPLAGGESTIRGALAALATEELADARASLPERLLRLLLRRDEDVVIYPATGPEGDQRLVFRLVDPVPVLQAGYRRVQTSLSMSGTLAAPADGEAELRYQVPLFGLPLRETLTRRYASPFPLRHQRWIYCTDTIGTYRERGNYLARYAAHIIGVGQATPGVTAVFFSSYAFLESVRSLITDAAELALIVTETRTDAEAAQDSDRDLQGYEAQLRALVKEHGRAYLFAVYKGKLSEGADFRDNLIKTVVCVSIPLEYPGLYHRRLQAVYEQVFAPIAEAGGDDLKEKAREYALDRLFLSLVLQACGRGIRHESDRCACVLLDRRYHEYGWRRYLEPRPYNLRQPGPSVRTLHGPGLVMVKERWDPALIRFVEKDN